MAYTDVFGGEPIQPADVGYTYLELTANTALTWPWLTGPSETALAKIVEVNAGAFSIILPDATAASPGESILFVNSGATTLTIYDASNATVTTITAGAVKYLYLTDNSDAAGQWTAIAFGVGSSEVDAAALAGYGLLATSTTLNQSCPVASITTATSVATSDRARLIVDTTGITVTLPSAATIGDNFFVFIRNGSSGTTTISPTGGDLIDTAASVALNPAESLMVISSGAAWYTVGWGRSVDFNYTQLTKSVAGGSNVTLTSAEAAYKILKFTGLLTANINVVVPTTTTIWYVDNSTTGAYTLTVKTSAGTGVSTSGGSRYVLYGDGTNVVNAVTTTGSFSSFTAGSASSPSITFAADTDTGAFNTAANQFGISAGGSQVANFTSSGVNITGAMAATGAVTGASASFTAALPVASGGTAIASYTIGDILYSSGTTTLSKLAGVATGNALISGGVATAPSWGKIALTTHVSGTLPVTNGGTGGTTAATARASLGTVAESSLNVIQDFRLTLTSLTPVAATDVTAASTIYAAPYKGNAIALYSGTTWNVYTSSQFSLAISGLTSGLPYDVFCYASGSTPTLEFTAWSSGTARATGLTYQDGILVKSGATTRRYLGTFYTTSTTTTEDSAANRYLFNFYNRVKKHMFVEEPTDTWVYTTAAWRQLNNSTANQLNFVIGAVEDAITATAAVQSSNSTANVGNQVGIGVDSTTAIAAECLPGTHSNPLINALMHMRASYTGFPGLGKHYLAALERSGASGTTTWAGDNGSTGVLRSGIAGEIFC